VSRVSITSVAKAATTAGTGLYLTHSLNNFPGVGDITSLFQEFKIQSIKLTFRLVNAPNNNAAFPTLYIAPQRFNFVQPGAVPTSVQDVWQFRGMKTYQFGPTALSYSQTFTPHYSLDVNNQALSTGEVRKAAWLGAAANAVNHASAVYWIDRYDTPTNNSHTIELETVLVLKCRGPK
jgi:hypothetical protein